MKKASYVLVVLFVVSVVAPVFSQVADTVWVDVDGFSENYTLTETIEGDTTATGERNNPNRVYGLRNGGWYYLSGRVRNMDYHLTVIGEPRSDELHPPVILLNVDDAGTSDKVMFEASDDITFKDLYFLGTDALGAESKATVYLVAENITLKMDNCVIDYGTNFTIFTEKPGVSIFATNNIVRNLIQLGSKTTNFRNFIKIKKVPSDTVWVENNTFINCLGSIVSKGKAQNAQSNYFYFDHNTIVNNSVMVFHFFHWANATITNNIFYSCVSIGDATQQRPKQLPDVHVPWAILMVDTIGVDEIIPEADRVMNVSNNAWFTPADILQMQADSSHKTSPISFITSREEGMFANKEMWPLLNYDAASILNEDPGFVNGPGRRAEWVDFNAHFLWQPYPSVDIIIDSDWLGADVEPFAFTWPIPEDLTYANSTFLTGADDGGPLGDRNWYPDFVSAVDDNEPLSPAAFTLSQNYPNPFNPVTKIKYNLVNATDVKLTIYDLLGHEVKTLVNNRQSAGSYTIQWNGTNNAGNKVASGMYFYQLETPEFNNTNKMMLLK